MLAIDRHRRILELIAETGSLKTAETAAALAVTDETIRKDLELLEKRGELVRTHGGASQAARAPLRELPLTERQTLRREEKRAIARLAAGRIRANETIFLDASSTTLTLAEFIPDLPLTILTNALNVFTALADRPQLELICTGGVFDAKSRSFIGLTAEKALQRYNIHRMFFSGDGIDLERGLSEANSRQAAFKERVVAMAEDVVYLADHTKLAQKAAFFFAGISDLTCLVTDDKADAGFLAKLRERGTDVMGAPI